MNLSVVIIAMQINNTLYIIAIIVQVPWTFSGDCFVVLK